MSDNIKDKVTKKPHEKFKELNMVDCGNGITKFVDSTNKDAWITSKATVDLKSIK